MRLLSSSVSITRYKVKGKIQGPLIKTIMDGLNKNSITEIDNQPMEKAAGWTSFDNPYLPDFEPQKRAHFPQLAAGNASESENSKLPYGRRFPAACGGELQTSSCVIGAHFVFSLRIDKKNIPSKIIKKYYTLEMAKKLAESGREYLSRNEKKEIKEHVANALSIRIPATPNIYDIIWNYEESSLWFFSNQKVANEDLETLFSKSFRLTLIRFFPYTMANLASGLTDKERDLLSTISPTKFMD